MNVYESKRGTYQTVIRQAKARTFNLKQKIEQAKR